MPDFNLGVESNLPGFIKVFEVSEFVVVVGINKNPSSGPLNRQLSKKIFVCYLHRSTGELRNFRIYNLIILIYHRTEFYNLHYGYSEMNLGCIHAARNGNFRFLLVTISFRTANKFAPLIGIRFRIQIEIWSAIPTTATDLLFKMHSRVLFNVPYLLSI